MAERNGDAEFTSFRQRYARARSAPIGDGESEPRILEESLKPALDAASAGQSAIPSVSDRLARKFGMGADPTKRRLLYTRLERLVEREGDRVLSLISEAVAQAVGARDPGRYFCKAVCSKIREAGLTLTGSGGGDATW